MEKFRLKKDARLELEGLYDEIGKVLSSDDKGNVSLYLLYLFPCVLQFFVKFFWCISPLDSFRERVSE